jgi:hypothetical protein
MFGKINSVNEEQFANAASPMDWIELCKLSLPSNFEQFMNASSSILMTFNGINKPFGIFPPGVGKGVGVVGGGYCKLVPFPVLFEIPVKFKHPAKHRFAMVVKSELTGNTIVPFKFEQFSNADSPNDFNPFVKYK